MILAALLVYAVLAMLLLKQKPLWMDRKPGSTLLATIS